LLNRKIDRVEANVSEKITANSEKIDHLANALSETRRELNEKIDQVAADLGAHRNDTERHRGYMVAEHPLPPGQH
jgi:outer membrane murein-binding lipoprotein Lpp